MTLARDTADFAYTVTEKGELVNDNDWTGKNEWQNIAHFSGVINGMEIMPQFQGISFGEIGATNGRAGILYFNDTNGDVFLQNGNIDIAANQHAIGSTVDGPKWWDGTTVHDILFGSGGGGVDPTADNTWTGINEFLGPARHNLNNGTQFGLDFGVKDSAGGCSSLYQLSNGNIWLLSEANTELQTNVHGFGSSPTLARWYDGTSTYNIVTTNGGTWAGNHTWSGTHTFSNTIVGSVNGDAKTLDGASKSSTAGNNTIVQRSSAGYIFSNYINTTANVTTASPSHIWVEQSSDSYHRKQTQAQFKTNLSLVSHNANNTFSQHQYWNNARYCYFHGSNSNQMWVGCSGGASYHRVNVGHMYLEGYAAASSSVLIRCVSSGTTLRSVIVAQAGTAPYARLYQGNSVEKLRTTSGGIAVYGAVTATGNVTAYSSDERLKNIIDRIDPEKALKNVCKWAKVKYQWNETAQQLAGYDGDKTEIGLLANEIAIDYPELTPLAPFDYHRDYHKTQEGDDPSWTENPNKSKSGKDYKTLDYGRLITVQAAAIEALSNKCDKLESEIAMLKDMIVKNCAM